MLNPDSSGNQGMLQPEKPETRPNVRVLLSLPRAEGTLKRIGTKGVVAVHLLEQLKSL